MNWLEDRAVATLIGAAVGDALGGATEGWTPEQIVARYGGRVTGIVPPYYPNWQDARPIAPYHKGDGHITDDTLMTQALVQMYAKRGDHLDAYAVAEDLVSLRSRRPLERSGLPAQPSPSVGCRPLVGSPRTPASRRPVRVSQPW